MSLFAQFGFLSLLAGSALGLPQGQSQGRFSWHGTVGSPVSRPASTSVSSSRSSSVSGPSSTSSSSVHTSTSTEYASTPTPTPASTSTSTSTRSTSTSTSTSSIPLTTSHSTTTTISTTSTTSSTTTSSAAASSSAASASTGKRGISYNDASYASLYESASEVTWGYNWWSDDGGLSSSYNFVPLLWGTASGFTDPWAGNVANMLEAGSTHLLSFNEPDLDSQSNLSPAAAAAAYKTYMQPYGEKAKLGSPAVTNGGGAMGLTWLGEFVDACSDCQIDFMPLHWYNNPGSNDDFKNHITTAYQTFGKPIWITEFGLNNPTDAEVISFLEDVLPWLDEQEFVERYAYFMTAENYLVSSGGTGLSDYGSTYASYTA